MKKIKKQVWLAASAVVIAGNLYLIFKEDSKAARTEWLTEWDRSEMGDVVESFSAEGVVVPSDEYPVYFDSSRGSLEQVLVKEGDAIQPGTSLFEYSSNEVDDEIARLTAEKDEAQQQISLIDNQISQLRVLLSQAESEESSNLEVPSSGDDEDNTTTVIQSGDASTSIEKDILQQETEKQKLQEQVKKFDTLTIPNTAILTKNKKTYVVVATDRGRLERRQIETGLHVDGVYQVVSGVEDGEVIVIDPYSLVMKHGPFITPINADHVKKKPWNELSRTEKMKYALMGFLS